MLTPPQYFIPSTTTKTDNCGDSSWATEVAAKNANNWSHTQNTNRLAIKQQTFWTRGKQSIPPHSLKMHALNHRPYFKASCFSIFILSMQCYTCEKWASWIWSLLAIARYCLRKYFFQVCNAFVFRSLLTSFCGLAISHKTDNVVYMHYTSRH